MKLTLKEVICSLSEVPYGQEALMREKFHLQRQPFGQRKNELLISSIHVVLSFTVLLLYFNFCGCTIELFQA